MIEIHNGDCLDVMKDIQDNSIDMIMSDPPYGTTACKWDSIIPLGLMWEQLKRVTKNNGAIVLMASQPFTTKLISSNMDMFKYCWVWEKNSSTGFLNAKKQPLRNTEDVCVFYKRQCNYIPNMRIGDRHKRGINKESKNGKTKVYGNFSNKNRLYYSNEYYPSQIIKIKTFSNNKQLHPTQKPVALMEYLIKTYTNKGDTVLDFCMGSGTTGVAAQNLNRKFIGIEKDKEYFDIAKNRIADSRTLFSQR